MWSCGRRSLHLSRPLRWNERQSTGERTERDFSSCVDTVQERERQRAHRDERLCVTEGTTESEKDTRGKGIEKSPGNDFSDEQRECDNGERTRDGRKRARSTREVRRLVKDLPRGYWSDPKNCREFLDALASELGVKSAADWSQVSNSHVIAAGGARLLRRHGNSIFSLLQNTFPEQEWRPEECRAGRLPRGHWGHPTIARDFLDSLAKSHGVTEAEEWQRVTSSDVVKAGGAGLLSVYGGSVARLLGAVYPELRLSSVRLRPKTEKGHFDDVKNRKAFLDAVAAAEGVRGMADWRRVTRKKFLSYTGAASVLAKTPGGTMWELLQEAYSAELAEEGLEAFEVCRQLPTVYWEDARNRTAFLRYAEKVLRLKDPQEWYRVARADLFDLGGSGLLARMSLLEALREAFPSRCWVATAPTTKKRAAQLRLCRTVEELVLG